MTCETVEKLLPAYVEGELAAAEKNLVEEHLRSCPACSLLLADLEATCLTLRNFPELEISADLQAKLYAIPSMKKHLKFKLRLSLDFLVQPSLQPILAAATVLLVLFSFYFFNPSRPAIDRSIDRQLHLGYSQVEKLLARAGQLAGRLNAYKENILVSIKEWNLLGGGENSANHEEESSWKKRPS